MFVRETDPGVWRVEAEDDTEAGTIRAMFALKVRAPDSGVTRTLEVKRFDDFAKMRKDAAAHWDQELAMIPVHLGPPGIFEPVEDPMRRELGLRCRRTGQEWRFSLTAVKNDVSRWKMMMTTPASRTLFATHPNFGKWARSKDPLAPCDGLQVNLETMSLEHV
jgi:hypothetical protein